MPDSFATLWTVAHQTPLSLGFPRQNTGVDCHVLLQGIFPKPGIEPASPTLPLSPLGDSLPLSHLGSPLHSYKRCVTVLCARFLNLCMYLYYRPHPSPCWFCLFFNFLFCIGVQLINNAVMVSGEWQRDSAVPIHVSILPPNSPSIQATKEYWAEFPVLYSWSLLLIHFKYSSVYMSISNFLTIPLLTKHLFHTMF